MVAGDVPTTVVHEDERTLAFRDIDPQGPTHVLVISKEHYPDVSALAAADPGLLAAVHRTAAAVAEQEGITAGGWRLVFNTGKDGGQTVFHVHGHVIGGRALRWPPG
jgi:histidine triad (HIT) family protein